MQIHQMTIVDFEKMFPNETACRTYLKVNRWPDGIKCPRCDNENVHEHAGKEHHWNCYECAPTSTLNGFVRHSMDEYAFGAVHTNAIEGFWSIVKRGIIGTFHKVSRKYLPRYVNEFEFRYNNRMNANIFQTAIRAY